MSRLDFKITGLLKATALLTHAPMRRAVTRAATALRYTALRCAAVRWKALCCGVVREQQALVCECVCGRARVSGRAIDFKLEQVQRSASLARRHAVCPQARWTICGHRCERSCGY